MSQGEYKIVPIEEKVPDLTHEQGEEKKKDVEKTWPQILAINVACLIALTSGLQSAWTSPSIVAITKDKAHYDISEDQASYFPILPAVSMMLTCGFVSQLYDYFGRKYVLIFTAVPQLLSWLIVAFATDVKMFYLARIISGVGEACYFSAVPAYVGEISSPKVRGSWGNAVSLLRYLGSFFINILGSTFTVWHTAYICMTLPIIFLMAMPFMPESPYFLIMKGRYEEAKISLSRLKDKKDIEFAFEKLKTDVERQMSETGTWKDLITIKSNRRGLFAAMFLRTAQTFGGMITFNFYNQYIFTKALGNGSAKFWSMVYSGLLCICVFFGASIVDILGRKKTFIVSIFFCGLLLFLESTYFFIDDNVPEVDLKYFGWFPVTGILLYCVFCAVGMAIVPTLMLGELFSASIKAKGLTVLAITTASVIFLANHIFYLLSSMIGLYAPFLFFSGCNIISTIISIWIIPETKGKTLEEIQQKLKR